MHPLLSLRKKIADHFGVDIGQIQAFRLMGKIIVPVACGLAFIGWLMSGLNQVSVNQRGVYERFGNPTDVLLLTRPCSIYANIRNPPDSNE